VANSSFSLRREGFSRKKIEFQNGGFGMLILSSNDILELLDIKSGGTLTKWRALGAGQAVIGRNKWDARKFLEWWLSNIYDGACAETDGSLAEARRDYWTAKAEGERLKVDREKGEFIPISEVTRETTTKFGMVVDALRNLPVRIVPQLVGQTDRIEIGRIIDLEIFAMQAVLASGRWYSSEAVEAAITAAGCMSPKQAVVARVQAERGMPAFMKYDPRRKVFTDTRDNTEVPLAEANEYVRAYPYLKFKNKEEKSQ
jgi:hypothetical protein